MKIAICGKMGSGKTTLAKNIKRHFFNDKETIIASFATAIKEIYLNRELLTNFPYPVYFPPEYKESEIYTSLVQFEPFMNELNNLDLELEKLPKNTKPRKHYQFIGEVFKEFYGKDIWANILFNELDQHVHFENKVFNNKIENIIIDDLRMNIEYETILKRNEDFIIVCVEVPEKERLNIISANNLGNISTLNHSSETEVDDIINLIKSEFYNSQYEFSNGRRITINNPNFNLTKERREFLKFILKNY